MSEFLTLVLAIYLADALFEVTRLLVTWAARARRGPARDARGRFLARASNR
jgi:hypothetical protein